jgi:predicted HicB family RNase H-like nuclease
VVDWPGLSFAAATQAEALAGVTDVVREALALMDLDGRAAPAPVRARPYSGRFVVRITPELHRALAAQAAEQNVSLNHLATEKLAA